jgi:predicted ATP-binding protein involved in virulence
VAYAYGASRRQSPRGLTTDAPSQPWATLFDDNATLRNAEEWILQTDYAASKDSPLQARARWQLVRIKDLLTRVLPDVSDLRVSTREAPGNQVRAFTEVHTADGWVPLSSLGLRYRTMTGWMVDFASRLFERYTDLEDPLTGAAVCLVDEIDLHMHPRWQREVITHLTNVFPNTQFIATAHSPLVVQAARDANIVVLRREGDHVVIDNPPRSVRNWRLDQILTSELFELPSARPPELDALLAARDRLLAKSKLTASDRRRLEALRQEIGDLPTGETPEDIEAMDLIRRAAHWLPRNPDPNAA